MLEETSLLPERTTAFQIIPKYKYSKIPFEAVGVCRNVDGAVGCQGVTGVTRCRAGMCEQNAFNPGLLSLIGPGTPILHSSAASTVASGRGTGLAVHNGILSCMWCLNRGSY